MRNYPQSYHKGDDVECGSNRVGDPDEMISKLVDRSPWVLTRHLMPCVFGLAPFATQQHMEAPS